MLHFLRHQVEMNGNDPLEAQILARQGDMLNLDMLIRDTSSFIQFCLPYLLFTHVWSSF